MSTGFDIVISPGDLFTSEPVKFYEQVLRLVLGSSSVRQTGVQLTSYRGQRPFDYGSQSNDPHVLFKHAFTEEKSVEELIEIIDGISSQDVYIGVTFTYDRLQWDNDICDCIPSSGWLVVEYESPSFDLGHGFRSRGSYRVHFDNRQYFTPLVVDLSRCPANHPTALSKLVEYGTNSKLVEGLFKEIANAIKPAHLFVVTEGQPVNPLNFHMVYHHELSGYLFDIQKTLQLHALGGGYFHEGLWGDHDQPYSSPSAPGSPYQDDIRPAADAKGLAEKLEFFRSILGGANLSEMRLSDEEVYEIITSCEDIEAVAVDSSTYLKHSNFLFGYLDKAYLALLDKAAIKSIN